MAESLHYKELLQALNESHVEFLIVGGYAVMKYTEPRYTKDLDIWVNRSPENSANVFQALARFGAPLSKDGITPETFTEESLIYQIGVPPVRIDILTQVTGVEFEEAWPNRVGSTIFGVPVHFISLSDLIANKQLSGRDSDLDHLKPIQEQQSGRKD